VLTEESVRAHRVEGNEQLGLEQTLRRDRWAARPGIKAIQFCRNGRQCRLGQFLHPAQRVIGRNPGLDREIVKHRGLGIDFAAHRCSAGGSGDTARTDAWPDRSLGFASPC